VRDSTDANSLNQCSDVIRSYHGARDPCPEWIDEDPRMSPALNWDRSNCTPPLSDNFSAHCKISGDLSAVPKPMIQGPNSKYHKINYNVNISFGPDEMSAHLTWEENVSDFFTSFSQAFEMLILQQGVTMRQVLSQPRDYRVLLSNENSGALR
jgi:hypothetical protein